MARTNLSGLGFVKEGYGQVEPNHLSAQRTGQIYAQLPANAEITKLQNGQFVKYDYVAKEVNFGSTEHATGEWMLVYNEVKVYRDYQRDCDFAMLADNYEARVYSPITGAYEKDKETGETVVTGPNWTAAVAAADPYEIDSTNDPMKGKIFEGPAMMDGKKMVPRVFKTNVGDIFTTNTIAADSVALGDELSPNENGFLAKDVEGATMKWQVVKVYTMPDGQPGAKIMRIA